MWFSLRFRPGTLLRSRGTLAPGRHSQFHFANQDRNRGHKPLYTVPEPRRDDRRYARRTLRRKGDVRSGIGRRDWISGARNSQRICGAKVQPSVRAHPGNDSNREAVAVGGGGHLPRRVLHLREREIALSAAAGTDRNLSGTAGPKDDGPGG